MNIELFLDISQYRLHRFDVKMIVKSQTQPPPFRFELLLPRPGIRLVDLKITDPEGMDVNYSSDDGVLTLEAGDVQISYGALTDYDECVGVDRDTEFNFPFVNDSEIFLSTGIFPFPVGMHNLDPIPLMFHVMGLPDGWQVYSSLEAGGLTGYKLDNFFWYAALDLAQTFVNIRGVEKHIDCRVVVQKNKSVPITADEFTEFINTSFLWAEANIGPYRQLDQINVLILQAPADYADRTNNTTFATGENVMNGILAYGPDSPEGYKILGCNSYREYLLQGLLHEILHMYTTTSMQGRHKSVLYPASECPPVHARMIGESLNLFFVYRFLGDHFGDKNYFTRQLESHLMRAKKTGRRNGLLDLYLLDKFLVKQGASLLDLFGALVKKKQSQPGPYSSGKILTDTLMNQLNIPLPVEMENQLLGENTPDYSMLFEHES